MFYLAQSKHPSIHPYRLPVPSSAVLVPVPEPSGACLHCNSNDRGAQRRRQRQHAAPLADRIILTFLPSSRRPQRYVRRTSSAAPGPCLSLYIFACVIYILAWLRSNPNNNLCFNTVQLCIALSSVAIQTFSWLGLNK